MKAIIYSGIVLFSAASVYGLADYYKSAGNGSLNNLYKEKEPEKTVYRIAPVMALITAENIAVINKQREKANEALQAAAKKVMDKLDADGLRKISLEDFSRGRIVPRMVVNEEVLSLDSAAVISETPVVEKAIDSAKSQQPE